MSNTTTNKTNMKLSTILYANGTFAYNSVTGLYWDGHGFTAPKELAAALDSTQLAVLRYTYQNVAVTKVPTLLDELCVVLNRTGCVGWFFNAFADESIKCYFLVTAADGTTKVRVSRYDSEIMLQLFAREADGTFAQKSYRIVAALDEVPGVLLEWVAPERRAAILASSL